MALSGLTARTGLLSGLETPLTSSVGPFPNGLPLLMLLLLMENDLYRLSPSEDLPDVCRSVWDLALRDISQMSGHRCSVMMLQATTVPFVCVEHVKLSVS